MLYMVDHFFAIGALLEGYFFKFVPFGQKNRGNIKI